MKNSKVERIRQKVAMLRQQFLQKMKSKKCKK